MCLVGVTPDMRGLVALERSLTAWWLLGYRPWVSPLPDNRARGSARPYRRLIHTPSGRPGFSALRCPAISGVNRCTARVVTGVCSDARPFSPEGAKTVASPFNTFCEGPDVKGPCIVRKEEE